MSSSISRSCSTNKKMPPPSAAFEAFWSHQIASNQGFSVVMLRYQWNPQFLTAFLWMVVLETESWSPIFGCFWKAHQKGPTTIGHLPKNPTKDAKISSRQWRNHFWAFNIEASVLGHVHGNLRVRPPTATFPPLKQGLIKGLLRNNDG